MKRITKISKTTVEQAMAYDGTHASRTQWLQKKNGHYRIYIRNREPDFYKTTGYDFKLIKKPSGVYGCSNYYLTCKYPNENLIMNEDDSNVCRIELSKKEYEALEKWSEHGDARACAIFHDLANVGAKATKGMWLNRYDEILGACFDVKLKRMAVVIAMHDLGLNASVLGILDENNNLEKLEIKSVNAD